MGLFSGFALQYRLVTQAALNSIRNSAPMLTKYQDEEPEEEQQQPDGEVRIGTQECDGTPSCPHCADRNNIETNDTEPYVPYKGEVISNSTSTKGLYFKQHQGASAGTATMPVDDGCTGQPDCNCDHCGQTKNDIEPYLPYEDGSLCDGTSTKGFGTTRQRLLSEDGDLHEIASKIPIRVVSWLSHLAQS